ncbi:hypothetical protein ElyMa_005731300 [Elysia marginata]|uniref:Uncharacterized protein n=1 Tax=Elysia marginata TaxID=1093978 RepID=A0AAV4FKF6_9GAST|nr:hypothetical protein ElyMa_005731300 [Elysia marginata]
MPTMPSYSLSSNNISPNPACLQSSPSTSYSCMLPDYNPRGYEHHLSLSNYARPPCGPTGGMHQTHMSQSPHSSSVSTGKSANNGATEIKERGKNSSNIIY